MILGLTGVSVLKTSFRDYDDSLNGDTERRIFTTNIQKKINNLYISIDHIFKMTLFVR